LDLRRHDRNAARLDQAKTYDGGDVMKRAAAISALESTPPQYLARIRDIPLLRPGEELELAQRYRDHGDRRALDRMVGSHLRLVVKMAFGYRGYGLPIEELVSEGNIGLVQAAERFDPGKGCRFATYALWWIKAAMQDYIVRSLSLVKIGTTTGQRKLFFNLRRTKASLSVVGSGDMHPGDVKRIADHLGVEEREVVEMNRRLAGDLSLNATDGDPDRTPWQDQLTDEAPSQEQVLVEEQRIANGRTALGEALTLLSDRERRILVARRLLETPRGLADIADEFGLSCERIRQIEAVAFEKVRKAVTLRAARGPAASPDRGVRAAAA
jgi:RNA polymerase sigma-32 factor